MSPFSQLRVSSYIEKFYYNAIPTASLLHAAAPAQFGKDLQPTWEKVVAVSYIFSEQPAQQSFHREIRRH
jgi:hypothetical protein